MFGPAGRKRGSCPMISMVCRGMIVVAILAVTPAFADVIDPGLWKIITRTATGGVIGPPHESSKCLTSEQTHDVATTFSPMAETINSPCAWIGQPPCAA